MKMTRAMLAVLMDGIKDAEMWLDYAEDATKANESDVSNWFMTHAQKRIDSLGADYQYIKSAIGLDKKVSEGDEIAEALESHIESQMGTLKNRIAEMR